MSRRGRRGVGLGDVVAILAGAVLIAAVIAAVLSLVLATVVEVTGMHR